MVPAVHRLDAPAEPAHGELAAKAGEDCTVDGNGSWQIEFHETHCRRCQAPLARRTRLVPPSERRRDRRAGLPETRALEAAVEVRWIVDPCHGTRFESR